MLSSAGCRGNHDKPRSPLDHRATQEPLHHHPKVQDTQSSEKPCTAPGEQMLGEEGALLRGTRQAAVGSDVLDRKLCQEVGSLARWMEGDPSGCPRCPAAVRTPDLPPALDMTERTAECRLGRSACHKVSPRLIERVQFPPDASGIDPVTLGSFCSTRRTFPH
ncbi:unnamed protein product [Pleuronectes platessa]|uniref:Uncharacterized protein n=1 Tax=Pleuronectes platessa TaxID=8262 RepID=A0A9N7YJY3_PLEPL|nr:unnamed protein product [Pleuronectes platessa]